MMTALTGQEVVSGIATNLRSTFSEAQFAKIYKDTPVQSLTTPCIFIHLIEASHESDIGDYAWWTITVDIRCHPDKRRTDIHTWARSVSPMIIGSVECITIDGDKVKSKKFISRVEDNVLHVIGTYRFRVIKVSENVAPDMQILDYGLTLKK